MVAKTKKKNEQNVKNASKCQKPKPCHDFVDFLKDGHDFLGNPTAKVQALRARREGGTRVAPQIAEMPTESAENIIDNIDMPGNYIILNNMQLMTEVIYIYCTYPVIYSTYDS